jgi:glycerol-3-phosphate cytidylyltransferase
MTTAGQATVIRGYVPGVFDMFHVGHLNLIASARHFCDHLTVGVVTDSVVEAVKGKPPVVPLRERMDIVAALRDVDEVVIDVHSDKFRSWQDLRYDVIFKGDDWKGTPKGVKLEADLAGVGSRVHYFPYTRHTSSTLLREVLGTLSDEVVALVNLEYGVRS